MSANENICDRVDELTSRAAADVVITRQLLLERQPALLDKALVDTVYSAANTALK